jgi:hypothetical protein
VINFALIFCVQIFEHIKCVENIRQLAGSFLSMSVTAAKSPLVALEEPHSPGFRSFALRSQLQPLLHVARYSVWAERQLSGKSVTLLNGGN